jgi:signal transduction histidine kinase
MNRSRLSGKDRPEAGLILVAAIIGAATLASVWPKHSPGLGAGQAVAGIVACVSLAAWRTRPVAVAILTVALAAFSPMAVPATILAVVNAALHTSLRRYLLLGAYVVAVAAIHAVLYLHHTGYLTDLIVAVPAVGVGLVARVRRTRAEADAERRLAEARAAERRRIAREMHDVLAHRISMLSVHAGALEYHPDVPPEDVAKAAGVIRSSAHAALGELREVINLLRSPAGRAEEPDREGVQPPQPTLLDVAQLIEESRQAGMRLGFELGLSEPERVPAATGRTIYRIVQEGLTNARKHAPGSDVDVDIGQGADGAVTVVVRNRPAASQPAAPTPPGSGTGLIGLAERVALIGGRLDHGPTRDGGFALSVTLPMPQ